MGSLPRWTVVWVSVRSGGIAELSGDPRRVSRVAVGCECQIEGVGGTVEDLEMLIREHTARGSAGFVDEAMVQIRFLCRDIGQRIMHVLGPVNAGRNRIQDGDFAFAQTCWSIRMGLPSGSVSVM